MNALKDWFFEDEGQKHQAAELQVVPPAPQASVGLYGTGVSVPPQTLDSAAQENLKIIEQRVYSVPSSYVLFQKVKNALGDTTDTRKILDVLQAANPGVTSAKILQDIETHLGIIASQKSEFDAQVTKAMADTVEAKTNEVDTLTNANAQAQHDIDARNARIAQLKSEVLSSQQSINNGRQRFAAIEQTLKTPLLQAKQLLSQ